MNDDWLFDGGPPNDPRDAELVATLGRLRHDGSPPVWPSRRRWWWAGASVAAAAAAAAVVLLIAQRGPPSWAFEVVDGAPCERCALAEGEWLETDERTRLRLDVADIGALELAPRSRLGLRATGEDGHRLVLERGRIDALVTAPPRLFVVETPSGEAIDLGCAYSLEVDDRGQSTLVVWSGAVELAGAGRVVRVVAGALAAARVGARPTVPRWTNAGPAFVDALAALEVDPAALPAVLAAATPRDTLSLWHVLGRVAPTDRDAVFRRLTTLEPGVLPTDEAAVLRLDPVALELLWRDLSAGW